MKGVTIRKILAATVVVLGWGHLLWINMTQLESVYGHIIAIPLLMLVTLLAAMQIVPQASGFLNKQQKRKPKRWSCWHC